MLLVADPDRAEGASTHNLEDGQRNGRRELFRNVTENKKSPAQGSYRSTFSGRRGRGFRAAGAGKPARQPALLGPKGRFCLPERKSALALLQRVGVPL